jgi:peptidyl-prolyl cis-trans isomerase A (cyclophilin A)
MVKPRVLALGIVLAALLAPEREAWPQAARKPGLYATFDTSMGVFVCELYEKLTPVAVSIFTGLVQGTKEWLTPKGQLLKKPFYDGVTFHRVVKGFAIQAGDPTRAGNFPAIAPFEDEIVKSLTFNRAGMLALANNSRPHTNRTQFFVTVAPAPHLNGKHTIFGAVVEGLDVVVKISAVRVMAQRPVEDVVLRKVTLARVGPAGK